MCFTSAIFFFQKEILVDIASLGGSEVASAFVSIFEFFSKHVRQENFPFIYFYVQYRTFVYQTKISTASIAQLVERPLSEREVVGSNPAAAPYQRCKKWY